MEAHFDFGPQLCILGRARVHDIWRGLRGMLWSHLCRALAFGQYPLDLLIIHLSGNDLARHSSKALILDVLRNLKWLKAMYLAMHILWSTIIPQLAWRDARNFFSVNTAYRSVNQEVCRAVCGGLGSVIGHQRIRLDRPEFFQNDGVHLSDLGLLLELD